MRIRITILFLLIIGVARAFDFSSVCPTGQTLYYTIMDSVNLRVEVTYPGPTIDSAYLNTQRPTGSLEIPEQVFYDGELYDVASIGTCAFAKCTGLDGELIIPPTISNIGKYAFLHCGNISTLVFKSRRCREAFAAFEGCSFDSIAIGDEVAVIPDGAFANSLGIETLSLPESVRTIGNRAFFNCPNLKSVRLPEYMFQIGDYAFCDCFSLDSISAINAWVIGKCAFRNVINLSGVSIGSSVLSIEDEAFFNCRKINALSLPAELGEIGDYAFYYCDKIDTVFCHSSSPPELGENVFSESVLSGVLCVYCEARDSYRSSQGWNVFDEICTFDPIHLTVVANNDTYGTVSVSGDLFCLDEEALIEAVPNDSCYFEGWNDGIMDNPRTVLMKSDTSFVALFALDTLLECVEGDCVEIVVRALKDRVYVSHAQGRSVCIYSITGSLVLFGRCVDEESCFVIPQKGLFLVCVEGDSHCYKMYLEGGKV